jgi:transposase, IS5 family
MMPLRGCAARRIRNRVCADARENWDYRELRERIADGLTLRQFTDFYCARCPNTTRFSAASSD